MADLVELKPCPFCEGDAATWLSSDDDWRIRCRSCFAIVIGYTTEERAITAWNTRASPLITERREAIRNAVFCWTGCSEKLADQAAEAIAALIAGPVSEGERA